MLSRVVSPEELDRNATRIPAFGWCGYLSLEWAERRSRGVGGGALDLRLSHGRTRMASFVNGLMRGCVDDAVCRKLHGLLSHLREAANAWRLDRVSGLWMDASDVQHMCISFPVVLWGLDTGSGFRRVMYPPRGNGVVSLAWAEEVMRTPAQLILDSAHFFPLDAAPDGVPALIGCLTLRSEGLLLGGVAPEQAPEIEELNSPSAAGSGGAILGAFLVVAPWSPPVALEAESTLEVGLGLRDQSIVASRGGCDPMTLVDLVSGSQAQVLPTPSGVASRPGPVVLRERSGTGAHGGAGPIATAAPLLVVGTPADDTLGGSSLREPTTAVGGGMERRPGTKWRATLMDEWVVRSAKCPRDLAVRKKCELVSLAGVKRQSAARGPGERGRRRLEDGSWAPGPGAEPPD